MEKEGREGGGICVLELRGRANEDTGGDLDLGEVSFEGNEWTEFGAACLDMLVEARLWAKVDAVLTLLPVRPRGRPVGVAVIGGAGPRRVGVCGNRVDDDRFRPESSREVNWSAMQVFGAEADADSGMLSFDEVRVCVVAVLPGARKELSRLGLGGGSIGFRSLLLPPSVVVSSGIEAVMDLSSCEGLRENDGSRLRRFDILEVEPVSAAAGMVLMFAFVPSPICWSLLMCSDGTSNIDVGRDCSPWRPGRGDCESGAMMWLYTVRAVIGSPPLLCVNVQGTRSLRVFSDANFNRTLLHYDYCKVDRNFNGNRHDPAVIRQHVLTIARHTQSTSAGLCRSCAARCRISQHEAFSSGHHRGPRGTLPLTPRLDNSPARLVLP